MIETRNEEKQQRYPQKQSKETKKVRERKKTENRWY